MFLLLLAVAPAALATAPALSAPLSRAPAADAAAAPDRAALLAGVGTIAAPGMPGSVSVYGKDAFPVVLGRVGRHYAPVIAAGRLGRGRVVAFGHNAYFGKEALASGDTGRLFVNAVRWAAGGKQTPRVAVFEAGGVAEYLKGQGIAAARLDAAALAARLSGIDVLIGPFSDLPAAQLEVVRAFARRSGGLVGGETGWGWQMVHDGAPLHENGGNRLFAAAGLSWGGDMPGRTAKDGFDVRAGFDTAPPELLGARTALQRLLAGDLPPDQAAQALVTVSGAAAAVGPDDRLILPRLRAVAKQGADRIDYARLKEKPVTAQRPLERLALMLSVREAMATPPEEVTAHPAAASFPGAIPVAAPRLARQAVLIDAATGGWHSTGLYAAPGGKITVTVSAEMARKGFGVRIGAHKDTLWHLDTWKRAPEVTRSFPLDAPTAVVANAFGGPLFVTVPEGAKPGTLTVTISGAVPAPFFVRGKTDLAEWKRTVRSHPAPWAELVGRRCRLTVPSCVVRDLDDPEALMAYWDAVMDACADLYAIPRERTRPERYCADVQISAGYMHSGYPIMTGDDVAEAFCDLTLLRGEDGNKVWGFYHELGHNHQKPEWTWEGCGEVTNNLFSLYGGEVFNAVGPDYATTHRAILPEARKNRLEKYLAGGANYADWKRDPFLALTLFIQLRQGFGWEPYKQVFAEYRTLKDSERPKTDQEKRDQFLVRFSRAVGRNLGPFFEVWGVPTSEQSRRGIANLPVWMPAELVAAIAKTRRAASLDPQDKKGAK